MPWFENLTNMTVCGKPFAWCPTGTTLQLNSLEDKHGAVHLARLLTKVGQIDALLRANNKIYEA